jgi:hypothetical protein
MNIGLGSLFRPAASAGPTDQQKATAQAAQHGVQGARDSIAKDSKATAAKKSIEAKRVSLVLPQKAAQVSKKKGA